MPRNIALVLLAVALCDPGLCAQTWQTAVDAAARTAPQSRILVLDIDSGRLAAAHNLDLAARTLSAPGSTLKPLLLYQLLAQHRWDPNQRIACAGNLTIAGRRLACSHPTAAPFDARQALAWSCNTYFSQVALTVRPDQLESLLRPTGILGPSGLASRETTADFHPPQTSVQTQLTFLGVEGIRITPLELASAYRWLAHEFAAHPDSGATQTVLAGLADSASFGMAGQAGLGGVPVAGKTGTAEGAATPQTHGWFAGLAPTGNPQVILVVYAPTGRGADAAHLAGIVLAHSPLVHK